ncbi:MAG: 2-dehydropantoate 2-reductase [Chloroflexi bacterium]|nr:2-dehydropantoate 2-reductase [Chloroflexota bacterium]
MKIAVVGAGGVGGYFGGMLAHAGADVTFLARGEHLRAIRERGLRLTTSHGDYAIPVPATDDPAEIGPVDLVLFCVKSQDTEQAARAIGPLVHDDTVILSLQNGVDNEDKIAATLGRGVVLAGVARIEAAIVEPGVVMQGGSLRNVEVGPLRPEDRPAAARVYQELQRGDFPVKLVEDGRHALWDKFYFLVAIAGTTALARATIREVAQWPPLRAVYVDALREAVAVAKADGMDLGPDAIERGLRNADHAHPTMRTSLERDLSRGRPLEVDALNGAIVRLAERHGVAAPVHRCIYAVLSLASERATRSNE